MNTSESYSNIKNKSTSESYPGQNVLISYITKNMKISYCRFLKSYHDIIGTSVFSDNWDELDHFWAAHFLHEGKDVPGLKNKVNSERLRYAKTLQMYWKGIINEYKKEKENLVPTAKKIIEIPHLIPVDNYSISAANDHSIPTNKDNIEDKNHSIPIKGYSISTKNHSKISYKNTKLNNFCYDILQKLDEQSNIHPFYKYDEKEVFIKNQMDLFTINSTLENGQYTSTKEFENDIRLIFRNCYTYNDIGSEIYCLGEELESAFNKIWTEKIIFQVKQKENLKRIQDTSDADLSSELVTKQIRVLEQNKDKLVYRQVVNDALLIASAYENLVAGNVIPFIEILKTFLSTRSKMSLFSADEPVLQAIVESLLPLKYRIPELSLVMAGTKLKGFGRFGYSDIFVLKGIGYNNVCLSYSYWSKEYGETKQTTIGEVLDNGVNQLKSYMNVISNGKTINYSSSGIFDEQIKITKSNPNKLKGFVILVVGFHRVLWRSVEEIISDYSYDKV
ncbi:bromodomain-containing protein [Rhizophagus irregularis DAOM 181602=DAOM 197198]|nr:bromodomain-containing protein [Rhizophagus irregularis DAOM 181602=DAOM 197198]